MSFFYDIHDEDIDVDLDMKEINLLVHNDDMGNVWATLTFDQIKEIYKKISDDAPQA